MTRQIDFRTGGWGHALHGSTWHAIKPRSEGHFWWKKKTERVSVMCHTQVYPKAGDTVLFTAKSGVERTALIVEVQPCRDPHDMFTLILEPIREDK